MTHYFRAILSRRIGKLSESTKLDRWVNLVHMETLPPVLVNFPRNDAHLIS
jgi:hypothetical protein